MVSFEDFHHFIPCKLLNVDIVVVQLRTTLIDDLLEVIGCDEAVVETARPELLQICFDLTQPDEDTTTSSPKRRITYLATFAGFLSGVAVPEGNQVLRTGREKSAWMLCLGQSTKRRPLSSTTENEMQHPLAPFRKHRSLANRCESVT